MYFLSIKECVTLLGCEKAMLSNRFMGDSKNPIESLGRGVPSYGCIFLSGPNIINLPTGLVIFFEVSKDPNSGHATLEFNLVKQTL